jgi:hypothetical protein
MLPVVLPYNRFRMGSSTGSHLPCEYTVIKNGKKAKKGKIGGRKWPKLTKTVKNGLKTEKVAPSNTQKYTSFHFEISLPSPVDVPLHPPCFPLRTKSPLHSST